MKMKQIVILFLAAFLVSVHVARGVETITFNDSETKRKISTTGEVVGRGSDFVRFRAEDGQIFHIYNGTIIDRTRNSELFTPFSIEEMKKSLAKEFSAANGFENFEILTAEKEKHIIVYNTSLAYAQWCGQLFEKLASSFRDFWEKKGLELHEPEFPLVAIVFANRQDFARYANSEGVLPANIIAYYNIFTNRIALYDISGIETLRQGDTRRATKAEIAQLLDRPAAGFNIGTIIHEAVHQISCNCGVQQRSSPYPLWLCEGLALVHEVPSRDSRTGWSISIIPNDHRLKILHKYLAEQPPSPLQEIIRSDEPLRKSQTASPSYSMAWGLTYYLLRKRPKELIRYMEMLQQKTIKDHNSDSPEQRLKDFEEYFGSDWKKLYKECGDYLKKL